MSGATFPPAFLWGAATAAHQTEGNNVGSDWWSIEHAPGSFVEEPSGDAADSFHRWPEDMRLAADAGLTDYRFSIEWARIEPEQGEYSRAAIAHYRAMVEGARSLGLRPMITLHHLTNPQWFAEKGGWRWDGAVDAFVAYVAAASPVYDTDVDRICTINEPNMGAIFARALEDAAAFNEPGLPQPDGEVSSAFVKAHRAVRSLLRRTHPHIATGWSVAAVTVEAVDGADALAAEYARTRQDVFFEAAADDDWVGVQSYTRYRVAAQDARAVALPVPNDAEKTLMGWEYYPAALGRAVRDAASASGGVPVIVTENGIATADDSRRIDYMYAALSGLADAMRDGVDVLGYYAWSLLDNYEWGRYGPTFGLVAVDRSTFARTAKPSLGWLGSVARANRLDIDPQTADRGNG